MSMLARHAEDLYWIGRYLERAEDTARMLDVTYHGALEGETGRATADMWAELLEVLYLEDEPIELDTTPGDRVGALLLADREFVGSIPALVTNARDNARATREWLSAEVWEALNELFLRLAHIDLSLAANGQPYDVLRTVRSLCHAATGAVEASMPRGEGHRFFTIGQKIERAMMTTRHLRVWQRRLRDVAVPTAYAEWIKLLKSVSAYEAYLRENRADMEGERVQQFLFQSVEFPRSVYHCLAACEQMLLPMVSAGYGSDARRRVGKVKALVEFASAANLGDVDFVELVEKEIAGVNEAIERDFFRPDAGIQMYSFEAF
jgi:uncharacterized alpha-E superfamily protein